MSEKKTGDVPHYSTPYGEFGEDIIIKLYGEEAYRIFCIINALKYRMRAGNKAGVSAEEDFVKEAWYLDKIKELENKNS